MKKLIFLLIMILLTANSSATANNETETVANFEEGSTYYDMTYGAKLVGTTTVMPKYTEDELNAIRTIADTDSILQSSTNLASLQAAVGEAMLGTETAIPSLNFADWFTYCNMQGWLTGAALTQGIQQIQNSMGPMPMSQSQWLAAHPCPPGFPGPPEAWLEGYKYYLMGQPYYQLLHNTDYMWTYNTLVNQITPDITQQQYEQQNALIQEQYNIDYSKEHAADTALHP